jgi:folate/biopterin transporter
MAPSSATLGRVQQALKRTVLLGYEPTPELIAILLVYFVQGIVGLSQLAISFFLKDELALSPAESAALIGLGLSPWTIKPLFGFISDGLPILGYRRRPYLVLAGGLGAGAWIGLATVVHNTWAAGAAIVVSSMAIAMADVIADSLVVERARQESISDTGSLQSLCWGTSALGGLLTAYLSGFLLDYVSFQTVFLITATFPSLVVLAAWFIPETPVDRGLDLGVVKQQVGLLRQAISRKVVWMPILFILLLRSTPSSESAFFYFLTNDLKFQPEVLGRIQMVVKIAALIGVWLFYRFFKTVPFRQIFGWTIVFSTCFGLSSLILVTHANRALGISDYWFSIGDSLILTLAAELTLLPMLVLVARICPPGIEATLFALIMSIHNSTYLISAEAGAWLTHWFGVTETDFSHLWQLVLVTNLSTLLPLPFLGLLPRATAQEAAPTDLDLAKN